MIKHFYLLCKSQIFESLKTTINRMLCKQHWLQWSRSSNKHMITYCTVVVLTKNIQPIKIHVAFNVFTFRLTEVHLLVLEFFHGSHKEKKIKLNFLT